MNERREYGGDPTLDARLGQLLLRASQPQVLGLTRDQLEPVPEWVEEQMAAILADPFGYARKRTRPRWRKVLERAALLAAACALTLFTLYHVSPSAQAWMDRAFRTVTTWWAEHTTFHFTGDQPAGTADDRWRPEWLPEGYEETREVDLSGAKKVVFENEEGERLILEYFPVQEGYMIDLDHEHSDYSEIRINHQTAHLFDSNTPGKPSYLVWYSEEQTVVFELVARFPGDVLIRIAESMTVQEQP